MAKGSEPDIADVIETAYEETFRSLVFHPTPDDIEVTARAVTVRIALDVPDGVSEVLRADPWSPIRSAGSRRTCARGSPARP